MRRGDNLLSVAPTKRHPTGKLRTALEEVRLKMIADAVDRHGNLEAAAKELGVSPITIYRVLRRNGYGFDIHTVKTIQVRRPK